MFRRTLRARSERMLGIFDKKKVSGGVLQDFIVSGGVFQVHPGHDQPAVRRVLPGPPAGGVQSGTAGRLFGILRLPGRA
eukprot:8143169-Pyramimonas_sp.AAC.2